MGKTSLVLELQRLASESEASVAELLRKALIVATKLKIADFKAWIEDELKGYAGRKVPEYRRCVAEIKAFNPYRGYIPCMFEDVKFAKRLADTAIMNPIQELEEMAKSDTSEFVVQFPQEILNHLMRDMGQYDAMKPVKFVAANHMAGVISVVRTTVLEWALKLEDDGILGDGMSFSEGEKQKAAESTSIHIQSFQGVLGDVTAGNLQIGNYAAIHEQLKAAGIPQDERNELENILDKLKDAKGEDRKSLTQRGLDWVARNKTALGTLSHLILGWFASTHAAK